MTSMRPDNPLTALRVAFRTYRVALAPRAGQKVLSLQSISCRGEPATPALGGSEDRGLRTEVRGRARTKRGGGASTEECLPEWHHPNRPVAAGIQAATHRPGAAAALTSDPIPWRARAQRKVALVNRAGSGRQRTPSPSPAWRAGTDELGAFTQTGLRQRFSSVFCLLSSVLCLLVCPNAP
jgi:hypothetical protein